MKRLVQKVIYAGQSIMNNPDALQRSMDSMSKDNWEFSGQLGEYLVFKRWEEDPIVLSGGSNEPRIDPMYYNKGYNTPSYPQYNSTRYVPNYNNEIHTEGFRMNPSQYGNIVKEDNKYSNNPFNEVKND